MADSDSWDDYPWINVEHYSKEHRSEKTTTTPKKKKKKKDLNKGVVPTAYKIRYAEDGTKWHSFIDILRPNSPPVEWPEYPDKPVEDPLPKNFSLDNDVSDIDEDNFDLIKEYAKLGIPESEMRKYEGMKKTKKMRKLERKIKKLKEKIRKEEEEELKKPYDPRVGCTGPTGFKPEIPELMDQDPELPDYEYDELPLPPHAGYGGGVTTKIEEDDYYPHDTARPSQGKAWPAAPPPRQGVEYDFLQDTPSGDVSTDSSFDRDAFWRELQKA